MSFTLEGKRTSGRGAHSKIFRASFRRPASQRCSRSDATREDTPCRHNQAHATEKGVSRESKTALIHGSEGAVGKLIVERLSSWVGRGITPVRLLQVTDFCRDKAAIGSTGIELPVCLLLRRGCLAGTSPARLGDECIDGLRTDASCPGRDGTGGHGIHVRHQRPSSGTDSRCSDSLESRSPHRSHHGAGLAVGTNLRGATGGK